MALIHQATLTPSKLEMLQAWVPLQYWSEGPDPSELEVVGAYRFDDPDGEVGVETHLLRAGPTTLQVPVTYRAAPLAGAESHLIATMEHSVLGTRWVYDGCADPVYARTLATTILTGGTEAPLDYVTDDGPQRRSNGTRVSGSGEEDAPVPAITTISCRDDDGATFVRAGGLELIVNRVIGRINPGGPGHTSPSLIGIWPGQDYPVVLVSVVASRS